MKKASIFDWLKNKANDSLKPKKTDTKSTQTSTQKREMYVFVTLRGKKFHYDPLCPGLRHAKEFKMDLSKARKAGYTACDKCCFDYLHY